MQLPLDWFVLLASATLPLMQQEIRKALILTLVTVCFGFSAEDAQPPVVDPGGQGKTPSDAIVLFDGRNLKEWIHQDGTPAMWAVEDGEIVCKTGTGNIHSKRTFSSAQIHIEFAMPYQAEAKGQARGNSGVYVQGRYEVQVLDSYRNSTYPDGSAGAIYGQSAPLVNVSRPPEQWQSYDIIFHAPKCNGDQVAKPATMTILHNGVLIQDHFELEGPTRGGVGGDVCEPGPILLQDHIHEDVQETALRFRNIWVRPLE